MDKKPSPQLQKLIERIKQRKAEIEAQKNEKPAPQTGRET